MRIVISIILILSLGIACSEKESEQKSFLEVQDDFKTIHFYQFSIQDSVEVRVNSHIIVNQNKFYSVSYNTVQDSVVVLSENNSITDKAYLRLSTDSFETSSSNNVLFLAEKGLFAGITENGKQIAFMNTKGELVKRVRFEKDFTEHNQKQSISTAYSPSTPFSLLYTGKEIYFPLLGHRNFDGIAQGSPAYYEKYYQQSIFGKINLEIYSPILTSIQFSDVSKNVRNGVRYNYPYPYIAYNKEQKLLLTSFVADKSVQVYNDGKFEKEVDFSSAFIKETDIYLTKKNPSPAELKRYFTEVATYMNIHYDQYRKLYYRIACHKQTYESEDGMRTNTFLDKLFSIIVLDENFEKVTEVKMDQNLYTIAFHITEEGLWFKHREKSERDKQTTFQLFKVNYN